METWARSHHLTINTSKTEYLAINAQRTGSITLAGTDIQPSEEIKCLGLQKHRNDKTRHTKARLEKAHNAMRRLQYMLSRTPHISAKHKLLAAQATIDATFLYGIETTSGKRN